MFLPLVFTHMIWLLFFLFENSQYFDIWSVGNRITTWTSLGDGFIGCWSENSVSSSFHSTTQFTHTHTLWYYSLSNDVVLCVCVWLNWIGLNVRISNFFIFSFSDEGLTPTIPEDCPPLLRGLMQLCWKREPNERLVSFFKIQNTLSLSLSLWSQTESFFWNLNLNFLWQTKSLSKRFVEF
jgi:hypothetical protein